ncbi:MAG: hypothetical protein NTY63_09515 [Candidatus Bipolaricaulota bacterium]|nr:hypothetical protein [Candidatus Bipolaricaulota bacterium]
MANHVSDSSAQRAAEPFLIGALEHELGILFVPGRPEGGSAPGVKLDGFSSEHRVLAEAYARHGVLKPAQRHKVATDILKMIYVERVLGGTWRKCLCFADEAAAQSVQGDGWLAQTVRTFGVEVRVYPLPADVRDAVIAAQKRQVMVNPSL